MSQPISPRQTYYAMNFGGPIHQVMNAHSAEPGPPPIPAIQNGGCSALSSSVLTCLGESLMAPFLFLGELTAAMLPGSRPSNAPAHVAAAVYPHAPVAMLAQALQWHHQAGPADIRPLIPARLSRRTTPPPLSAQALPGKSRIPAPPERAPSPVQELMHKPPIARIIESSPASLAGSAPAVGDTKRLSLSGLHDAVDNPDSMRRDSAPLRRSLVEMSVFHRGSRASIGAGMDVATRNQALQQLRVEQVLAGEPIAGNPLDIDVLRAQFVAFMDETYAGETHYARETIERLLAMERIPPGEILAFLETYVAQANACVAQDNAPDHEPQPGRNIQPVNLSSALLKEAAELQQRAESVSDHPAEDAARALDTLARKVLNDINKELVALMRTNSWHLFIHKEIGEPAAPALTGWEDEAPAPPMPREAKLEPSPASEKHATPPRDAVAPVEHPLRRSPWKLVDHNEDAPLPLSRTRSYSAPQGASPHWPYVVSEPTSPASKSDNEIDVVKSGLPVIDRPASELRSPSPVYPSPPTLPPPP